MEKSAHTIKINPIKAVALLLIPSILIIIFSLIGRNGYNSSNPIESFFITMFTEEFYVNNLVNIAVYWNLFLLTVASVLIIIIASAKQAQKDKHRYEWWVLGFIFFYFAVDALSGITSKFINLLQGLPDMQVGTYYNWLYAIGAFVLILTIAFFVWFYFHLDVQNKILFPVSIVLYILGAYRETLISGYYGQIYGKKNLTFSLLTHTEQLAGYIGVILLIYMLLVYIISRYLEIELIPTER